MIRHRDSFDDCHMLADDETTQTLDDAIAWCLAQRDSGTHVDEQVAIETFPQYAEEIRSFLRKERKFERALAQPLNERAPSPPRDFGKYELRRTIGAGAFGQVYLAWDTEMRRHVALKTARFVCSDGVTRERFLHEARASAQLRHHNIVRIFDFGEVEGTAFLALEFVEGKLLSKWANGAVDPLKATRMVTAIVDALVHAHGRGIVHRDLTPKNIIIDEDDQPNILDFGLAKLVSSQSTLRMTGEIVGTPSYVSPEQVTGKAHEVDGRSDIYSVGVILYELLTGERPLDGPLELLLHRIQFDSPSYLCEVDPAIPRALADICKKCLEKRPEDRYANTRELHADLQGSLNGGPVRYGGVNTAFKFAFAGLAVISALLVGKMILGTPGTDGRNSAVNPATANTVSQDYTDLDLGLTLISEEFSFDNQAPGWDATGDSPPANEYVVLRDWTPDSLVRSESGLGSAFISLPNNEDSIGYHRTIDIDSGSKYHVVEIRGFKLGGWANFCITYCDSVKGEWHHIKGYKQRFRGPSGSQRGSGDGMALHRMGCEIPKEAVGAVISVWQEEAEGSGLEIDDLAVYDYVPVGDENLVLAGKFTIGEIEEVDYRRSPIKDGATSSSE